MVLPHTGGDISNKYPTVFINRDPQEARDAFAAEFGEISDSRWKVYENNISLFKEHAVIDLELHVDELQDTNKVCHLLKNIEVTPNRELAQYWQTFKVTQHKEVATRILEGGKGLSILDD